MNKKKPMKKKSSVRKVDDFSAQDKGQSKAMNIDEKNPKLAKIAERKV